MRNLKRALSLLLAAAMLIGMMVVGASAAGSLDDFSDKDEIANQDAVSLLTILGVIEGKEDGSYFDPTGNVTRAEMAKMIATILNQGADVDGLYTGMNTGLTDVSGHWAESYINYCYSLGIIAGRGDGTFDPGATVTGTEAAKMLLVAAGYDASIEGLTGADWAIRTAALASTLGIFDNLTAPTGDPLNRDNAALLVYNALDIEMIQSYRDGYAIAYGDKRTILSTKYGVYRLEGEVIGNEWAQLEGTTVDAALATGKTRLTSIRLVDSNTQNTINGVYEDNIKGPQTFSVSTPVEYLGQTVTMYVRDTTVLANAEVLGVYLKEGANTILTTAGNQDTVADYLKGTGVSVNANTEYYVNYGVVGSESAAKKALSFDSGDRFTSVSSKSNANGVELTVIDNDQDGVADYVLWLQETLSQVIAKNDTKETTTLSGLNSNKAIDNEDIVTDLTMSESDLVLAVSYGGRYYVSAPEVVTGQMESFSSSKEKQQYIEVNGTQYNPSFIVYEADSADNTYEFDVLDCGTEDGVDFDIDYDFILDSNGNVIAYRPSEQGLYDYALILDSGYDPGRTTDSANGEVKVLLPDGTEGTYELNWSASAQNIGDQLYPTLTSSQRKDNGVETLKSFLGTSVHDNTTSEPDGVLKSGATDHYWDSVRGSVNASGHAAGYVVGYSLNSDNVLTITSIVGSNNTGAGHYSPTAATEDPHSTAGTLSKSYNSGAARVEYNNGRNELIIDKNTVAFYYTTDSKGDTVYGVAVGYNNMSDVNYNDAAHNSFVASTVRDTTLASSVLFNAEGVLAEKNYAYVLSTSRTDPNYVTLNVILMDGTASTLKIERSDWDNLFSGKPEAFNTVYSYTLKNDVATLTPGTNDKATEIGYAKQLRSGTVAFYEKNSDGTVGKYLGAYSYENNIWNVEDISAGTNAPKGAFAQNVYKEAILVLDSKEDTVRAAYIKSVYDGVVTDPGHDFNWVLTNYKTMYPDATATEIMDAMDDGYNVRIVGDYTLTNNIYLRDGKILYVTGNLTSSAVGRVSGDGTLWVGGHYTETSGYVTVDTQVAGNVTFGTTATTIYGDLAVENGAINMNGQNLTIETGSSVYANGDVVNSSTAATLTVKGTLEANNYNLSGNAIEVLSANTLIARGNVTAATLTIGSSSAAGRAQITGTVTANVTMNNGSLNAQSVSGTITRNGGTVILSGDNASTNLGGKASGTYAGDVSLAAGATVAAGETLTVDGDLTVSGSTVTVSGTLELNGSADVSKLAGAAGGKVVFGNSFKATGITANFVNSNGDVLSNDQLAGRTFTYNTTSNKFVTTSVLTDTAEITKVELTAPTGDSDYTIKQDTQVVDVTITDSVNEVKITVTPAGTGTIAEATDKDNKVSVSDKVITVDTTALTKAGDAYSFTIKVSETGKNSSTYTFNIKVVEDKA